MRRLRFRLLLQPLFRHRRLDFETANEQRTSVCSVGVVIVRDGEIVDHYYSLIRPEPEYYTYWNTRVHGLTLADTQDAPIFPVVWQEIAPRIEGLSLVAHNKAFDESCLKAVFRTYCMDKLIEFYQGNKQFHRGGFMTSLLCLFI